MSENGSSPAPFDYRDQFVKPEIEKLRQLLVCDPPISEAGNWRDRLLWALRLTPTVLRTNYGSYWDGTGDLEAYSDEWRYPADALPVVEQIVAAINAALTHVKDSSSIAEACRRECPGGFAKWLIGLRNYVLRKAHFAPLIDDPRCWDPCLPADECIAILVSDVCAALEAAPEADPQPPATGLDELVTLDQAAAIFQESDGALGRYLPGDKRPRPDVPVTAEATDSTPAAPPADSHLSPRRLAEVFDVPPEALRRRLGRWRRENHNGWIENPDRGPREPQYLYRVGSVLPIIQSLKASGETSGECPAKTS